MHPGRTVLGVSVGWVARAKLQWIKGHQAGSRLLLSGLKSVLFRPVRGAKEEAAIRRILVYRIGNVGDVLVGLPALGAIRTSFPGAHIALMTSPGPSELPGAEQVLPAGKWFDELVVYYTPDVRSWKGRIRLLRRLRAGRFDLFVELPNQQSGVFTEVRNLIVARLAGCRSAVGFEISMTNWFRRE